MRKALECINKNHKFIKRAVLMNSHKFVMPIKMSLYSMYYSIMADTAFRGITKIAIL